MTIQTAMLPKHFFWKLPDCCIFFSKLLMPPTPALDVRSSRYKSRHLIVISSWRLPQPAVRSDHFAHEQKLQSNCSSHINHPTYHLEKKNIWWIHGWTIWQTIWQTFITWGPSKLLNSFTAWKGCLFYQGTSSQIRHADGHMLRQTLSLTPDHPACPLFAPKNVATKRCQNMGKVALLGGVTNENVTNCCQEASKTHCQVQMVD